jgi:hypothetical protein
LSGNAFSYRSMAVWMTNISHGVSVIEHLPIGYDPGIDKAIRLLQRPWFVVVCFNLPRALKVR